MSRTSLIWVVIRADLHREEWFRMTGFDLYILINVWKYTDRTKFEAQFPARYYVPGYQIYLTTLMDRLMSRAQYHPPTNWKIGIYSFRWPRFRGGLDTKTRADFTPPLLRTFSFPTCSIAVFYTKATRRGIDVRSWIKLTEHLRKSQKKSEFKSSK